jgi:hypothetical protein
MNGGEFLLTKVLTAVVLGAMARAALRRAPTTTEGNPVLAHGRVIGGAVFVFVVVVPVVIGYLCYLQPPRDPVGMRNVIAILAIFLGIGLPLGWEWLLFRCVLTDCGFDYRSAWSGPRFIPLEDVVSLSYGAINSWFILTTRDGRRHRVSTYVVGIRQFTAYCRRRLPREVWQTAFDGFAVVEKNGSH